MNSYTQANVNLGLHPSINSSNRSTLRRLSLFLISALVITVGCTPPCRFDEESNCVPGEEMLAGTEVPGISMVMALVGSRERLMVGAPAGAPAGEISLLSLGTT